MTDFPGYVEITCPFCDQYRHAREAELPSLQHRTLPEEPTQVVCDVCWHLVGKFIQRAALGQTLGIPKEAT